LDLETENNASDASSNALDDYITDKNQTCIQEVISENDNNTNDDNIEITRVIQSQSKLKKEVPFMNSTENIFADYDAAMIYNIRTKSICKNNISISKDTIAKENNLLSGCFQKMDEDRISIKSTKSTKSLRSKTLLKLNSSLKSAKSESDIKFSSRNNAGRLNKSESNLQKHGKMKRFGSRKSSLKSSITSAHTIKWNFDYISPYGLNEEQKMTMQKRKLKLQRKQNMLEKKKRLEAEKRKEEGARAFEEWLQKKKELAIVSSNKLYKYT